MGIRTLTNRLLEETEEARRRQNYTGSRSPGANGLRRAGATGRDRHPESGEPQPGGHRLAAETPAHLNVDPPPRGGGLRIRNREDRWKIPGGIAARFGLRPEPETQPAPPYEEAPHPPPPPAEDRAEPDENSSAERPNEDQEAAPITIELKSH